MWAEKEFHNLTRMAKAGVPCPKVKIRNILIVFISLNKSLKCDGSVENRINIYFYDLIVKVVMLKKHLLILTFLGENGKPAPKLKEVTFPSDDDNFLLRNAYQQVINVS